MLGQAVLPERQDSADREGPGAAAAGHADGGKAAGAGRLGACVPRGPGRLLRPPAALQVGRRQASLRLRG